MNKIGLDTTIGNQFMDVVCEPCKHKIILRTKRLSKWALLNPIKTAKMFQNIICKDCKKKIVDKLNKQNESTTK